MNCVVTAGPTFEPLDAVRRLTNSSTGQLGSELANFLVEHGHFVALLLGQGATHHGKQKAQRIERFTTTADLKSRLDAMAGPSVQAVFHAAAVSDFAFGKVWTRSATGDLTETRENKISTEHRNLLAELRPTPKLIGELRRWFPQARLVGWKYEVDGDRTAVIARAKAQIERNLTNACVANGPAYGAGYGLVMESGECEHAPDAPALYRALREFIGD